MPIIDIFATMVILLLIVLKTPSTVALISLSKSVVSVFVAMSGSVSIDGVDEFEDVFE